MKNEYEEAADGWHAVCYYEWVNSGITNDEYRIVELGAAFVENGKVKKLMSSPDDEELGREIYLMDEETVFGDVGSALKRSRQVYEQLQIFNFL